jgi:hypothetical protein
LTDDSFSFPQSLGRHEILARYSNWNYCGRAE